MVGMGRREEGVGADGQSKVLLVARADVNAVSGMIGFTALHHAIHFGRSVASARVWCS